MEENWQRVEDPERKTAHGSTAFQTLRNAWVTLEKRWALFLTPLRLAVTIMLFVLGVWVHSVYDNHVTMEVTLQNTRFVDTRLAAMTQELAGLARRLAQDEELRARRDAQLSGWVEAGERDRRALRRQAGESSKALSRLDARLSEGLIELEAALRERESAAVALRAQSEAVSAELSRRLDAAAAEREEHVRKLERLAHEFAALQSAFRTETDEIEAVEKEISNLRENTRWVTVPVSLTRHQKSEPIAGMSLELDKTNAKKQEFTLKLTLDQIRLKKKGLAREPVFIWPPESARPYRIVILRVEKNKVSGFLSLPADDPQLPKAQSDAFPGG